jgi:hypothetical protein
MVTESNLEKYVVNEKTNAEVLEVWRAMIVDFKGGIISVRNSDYLTNRDILFQIRLCCDIGSRNIPHYLCSGIDFFI